MEGWRSRGFWGGSLGGLESAIARKEAARLAAALDHKPEMVAIAAERDRVRDDAGDPFPVSLRGGLRCRGVSH